MRVALVLVGVAACGSARRPEALDTPSPRRMLLVDAHPPARYEARVNRLLKTCHITR